MLLGLHTRKHRCASPSANAEFVHPFQGCKAIVGVDTRLSRLIQLIRENVQHELAVALGVDMPVCVLVQELAKLGRVDQVAVVGHTDAVWTVDVEWLCLGVRAASGRGVSKVTQSHEARKVRDPGAIVEDLGGHTVALALVEAATATAAHDTRRILPAMLEKVERIVTLYRGRL
jgi:hypothetical protein